MTLPVAVLLLYCCCTAVHVGWVVGLVGGRFIGGWVGQWVGGWVVSAVRVAVLPYNVVDEMGYAPVLHRPQKKSEKPISGTNPRLEAPLPPFYSRTTFRISAITPALPLIEKSTTLRSSLRCSHCIVAKRQQFSCPLGTTICR